MKRSDSFLGWLIVWVLAIVSSVVFAQPANAAVSFKGKVISFVCPFAPGGGSDIYARLLALNLKAHIPGNPGIIVRNVSGGGGVIGANLAWVAKPDGKTLLLQGGSTGTDNIMRRKGVDYKLEEMRPIFSGPSGIVFFAKPKTISNPKEILTTKGIIYGQISAVAGSGSCFAWSKELLGFKTEKMIWGYDGSSAARGAFHQGEINFTSESTQAYNSALKSFVEKGEAIPIFQSGLLDFDGNVVREPSAPNVPTVPELYEQLYGKKPSGPAFEAYKLIVGTRTYGKTLLLPKNTPADIADMYDQAVAAMVKDPKFLRESERLDPGAQLFIGKKLVSNYPKAVSGPPDLIQYMKKVLSEKYGVVFE